MKKSVYVSEKYTGLYHSAAAVLEKEGFGRTGSLSEAEVVLSGGSEGEGICRKLRKALSTTGIILVFGQREDFKEGFLLGADDCVTPDIPAEELAARIIALDRRVRMCISGENGKKQCGSHVLDCRTNILIKDGESIGLTPVECRILECLFSSPGAALTRKDIIAGVWGGNYYGAEKVVDVNIRRLRVKIEKEPSKPGHLLTVWGKGYMWRP